MAQATSEDKLIVVPFTWCHWPALWQLRWRQLAEHGIDLSPAALPPYPAAVPEGDAEWDYHHLAEVYLRGAGGFWLAYQGPLPVGHIGAQAIGDGIELRRMYVRADYRRRGIGQQLVVTLVTHCCNQGATIIELWTAAAGPGRRLYASVNFQPVDQHGPAFANVIAATGYRPGSDEIRLRLQLD